MGEKIGEDTAVDTAKMNQRLSESMGHRQTAIEVLRHKAKILRRRSDQLYTLANVLQDIEESAHQGVPEGSEARHPYIGAGSDAETALWELVCGRID